MVKIVLIGAGSAVFGLGTVSDVFQSSILEGATITLHDINSTNLKTILVKGIKMKSYKLNVKPDFQVNNIYEAVAVFAPLVTNQNYRKREFM